VRRAFLHLGICPSLCVGRRQQRPMLATESRGEVKPSGQLDGTEAFSASSHVGVLEQQVAQGCVEQLARFFPQALPVRLRAQVSAVRSGSAKLHEAVTVEFASPELAIFASSLPLEFDDRVRLEREGKSRKAEATVIAMQYHEGRKAVAVKFTQAPCEWVMLP
jgi:hypothetical protein